MARSDVLVSADWVEENLSTPTVVLVEVDEDTSAYDTGHIEGAITLDWRKDLQDGVRRDFLDRDRFSALLSAKGVANDDTVVLYGGNNNWFAAYAYWYFTLYGHRDVRLLDGGRKKWELDGRPLSREAVTREATEYRAGEPDRSIRAFRDEVIDAIGTKNLIDVRSPDEFSGKIAAPAHLPQEQAPRPRPRRDQHPVEHDGQRGRHLQVRRGTDGAVRGQGIRRQPRDHRVLPHRRALEPYVVRPAGVAREEERQDLRRKLGRVRLARRSTHRVGGSLIMCGAPVQTQNLPAGVDVGTETVVVGRVLDTDGNPVGGAFVRLLDGTGEFTAEVVASATGDFRFFAAPGTWTVRALSPVGNGDTTVAPESAGVHSVDVTVAR